MEYRHLGSKFFYYLLAMILILHVMALMQKFNSEISYIIRSPTDAIKIKIINDLSREKSKPFKQQIVQSEDSDKHDKKSDSFLSDKDRSFERQTVSKNINTFKSSALGNADVNQNSLDRKSRTQKQAVLKNLKLSDVGIPVEKISDQSSRSTSTKSQVGRKNGDPRSFGYSASNDYVEEIRPGDLTQLNTVEYKFYGYYHRIRQRLEQFWGKSIKEKAEQIFRSGRRLPASENLITSLQVTLNSKGEIVAVKILGASGVKELDDAAIESFNQAGPFPNPPTELIRNDRVTIDWGFVVKS
jgi:TonB family protein